VVSFVCNEIREYVADVEGEVLPDIAAGRRELAAGAETHVKKRLHSGAALL
jgi:hypothetical protein